MWDAYVVDFISGKVKRIARGICADDASEIRECWKDASSTIVVLPFGFRLSGLVRK